MHDTPPASVLVFLEGLGLAQYAAAFEAQLIDLSLLPALSDAQLQELGVAAMGHRIKLLRAAAALLAQRQPPPPPQRLQPKPPRPRRPSGARSP